jgi:hypothetical protein
MDLVAAAGLETPAELAPGHISQRTGPTQSATYAEIYPWLESGELRDGAGEPWYRAHWQRARADSFLPASND